MDPVTLGIVGSGIATAGINAVSTYLANRQNVKAQKQVNAQQLAYQKNAYSYAAADRMRAGLSPLDSQAASSPSLGAPTVSPVDVGPLGDSVVSAVSSAQRQQEIDTNRQVASAQAANLSADTDAKLIDNLTRAQDNYVNLLERYEDLQKKHSENSVFMQNFQKEMDLAQATIKELQAKVVNLASSTRVNNATATEQESQNKWSEALNLPPSLLRSVSANDPQAMLIFNGLLHQWQQRSAAKQAFDLNDRKDLYAAYQDSVRRRQEEIDQTDKEIKAYNASGHKGQPPYGYETWQDYRKALAERKKNMKLLSFDEWLKLAHKYGL